MITLSEHVRGLWSQRQNMLQDAPPDLPEWVREMRAQTLSARLESAGKVDAEIHEALKTMRELGILA